MEEPVLTAFGKAKGAARRSLTGSRFFAGSHAQPVPGQDPWFRPPRCPLVTPLPVLRMRPAGPARMRTALRVVQPGAALAVRTAAGTIRPSHSTGSPQPAMSGSIAACAVKGDTRFSVTGTGRSGVSVARVAGGPVSGDAGLVPPVLPGAGVGEPYWLAGPCGSMAPAGWRR